MIVVASAFALCSHERFPHRRRLTNVNAAVHLKCPFLLFSTSALEQLHHDDQQQSVELLYGLTTGRTPPPKRLVNHQTSFNITREASHRGLLFDETTQNKLRITGAPKDIDCPYLSIYLLYTFRTFGRHRTRTKLLFAHSIGCPYEMHIA